MNLIPLIERMIRNGQTEGMQEKLDTLMVVGRLSTDVYQRLLDMLNAVAEKEGAKEK